MEANSRLVYSTEAQQPRPEYQLVIKHPATAAGLRTAGFKLQLIAPTNEGRARWLAPPEARAARDLYERELHRAFKETRQYPRDTRKED